MPNTIISTIIHTSPKDDDKDTLERHSEAGTRAATLTILNKHEIPNVPQLYEIRLKKGEDNIPQRTVIIEKFDGLDLEEILKRKSFSIKETIYILRQIATISTNIVNLGIFHNDIKLSNIILQEDGTVKLIDFGAATIEGMPNTNPKKPHNGYRNTSNPYDIDFGTQNYRSPERYERKTQIDSRSEIFSIAKVGIMMLTQDQNATSITSLKTIRRLIQNHLKDPLQNDENNFINFLFDNGSDDIENRCTTIHEFKCKLEKFERQINDV